MPSPLGAHACDRPLAAASLQASYKTAVRCCVSPSVNFFLIGLTLCELTKKASVLCTASDLRRCDVLLPSPSVQKQRNSGLGKVKQF